MKTTGNTNDVIYKEVVVIGNGPSGIALSYMLSGNLPFITSNLHPDEMLALRLENSVGQCLINENVSHLANGLEGRSTNPISLLLDALLKPCADIGMEMEPLVEFRKAGKKIDHVVLGKGPPGGSWHRMDPDILTLSLGSWMALPGYPFLYEDSGEKRALASTVANYYVDYVNQMGLTKYFNNHTIVSNVTRVKRKYFALSDQKHEIEQQQNRCSITSLLNYVRGRKSKARCCKRPRDSLIWCQGQSPERKLREIKSRNRSASVCDDDYDVEQATNQCDNLSINSNNNINLMRYSKSLEFTNNSDNLVPFNLKTSCDEKEVNWLIETHDVESGETTKYSCKYLVLANGTNDVPNKLQISQMSPDPSWLFHDLRTLELHLDNKRMDEGEENVDPVLIVGAGLSAADAIIATRARNIPVCHVFRNKLADLNRKLPENMYPEYHKVHQMMQDGGQSYPNYTAYPEYDLESIDDSTHSVILSSKKTGESIKLQVSFVCVLIGSRPDLTFLPAGIHYTLNSNTLRNDNNINQSQLEIDKTTHCVNGFNDLFAIGPLAGDNFVRFIPGGAFAVVSQIYKNDRNLLELIK